MTVIKNNLLRHDGEGRLLDQTGAFLMSTAQSIGNAVVVAGQFSANAITAVTPVIASTAWTVGVFGYTAIASTVITGCSAAGNIAVAGYTAYQGAKIATKLSNKAGQAVDTLCEEIPKAVKALDHVSRKVGSAATSLAKSANRASDSCHLVSVAAAATLAVVGVTVFRNSICATNPDSIFCISPSLTTLLIVGMGLGILGTCTTKSTPQNSKQMRQTNTNKKTYTLFDQDSATRKTTLTALQSQMSTWKKA